MRKAVGPSILGVVFRGMGLGLRTKECDFESVVGQVYSEEESKILIGDRREAANLPLSWSKAAVQAFLPGWPCTVEASFRAGKTRSAIIRSAVPPHHRRLQHDFGVFFSLIRRAEPRKRQNAQVQVWSKPGKTTAESQKAATSWASVVRGNPAPPVTAKRPFAGSESMDATALGAITPTQVQDNNLGPTQVSLSPRSQRLDTPQPPQSPVLADSRAATGTHGVGAVDCHNCRTARGFSCIPSKLKVMKNADNEVRRTRWFLLRIWRKRGGHGRSPWRAKIQLCQTYAVMSGVGGGGAVFKASRRFFVAFSCAVLSYSVRSSPTMIISQGLREWWSSSHRNVVFFLSSAKVLVLFYQQNVACTVPPSSTPRHCFQCAWPDFFLQAEVSVLFFSIC